MHELHMNIPDVTHGILELISLTLSAVINSHPVTGGHGGDVTMCIPCDCNSCCFLYNKNLQHQ